MSKLIGIDPPPRPLVIIGIPCGDMLHSKTAMCLWGLGRGAKDHRQGMALGSSSIVANARNQCVQGALAAKGDYLMFLDSDMLFPMNTIDRLLAHKKDIVCATYVRRGPPFDNLGHAKSGPGINATSGLIELTHAPTGIMLIKMSVFEKLSRPYFRYDVDLEEGENRGEDFVFSKLAMEAGFRLWCDIDLSKEIGHIYHYILMTEDPSTRKVADEFAAKQMEAASG